MKSIYNIMLLSLMMTPCLGSFNVIKKIFAHPIMQTDDTLELGNIIFYFEKEQVVNLLKKQPQGNRQENIYFFPMAQLSGDEALQSMVRSLAQVKHPWYQCSVQAAQKPIPGVKLIITYDPEYVEIVFNSFRSLNLKEGIMFRFCNKKFLKTLQGHHQESSVVKTVQNDVPGTIVIDCGHGGDDDGAVYYNVKEKDVNLDVGLRVAELLKKKGLSVRLTRETDMTVPLKDRIIAANNEHASLFVSIHSNAALNGEASGIETYGMVPVTVPQVQENHTNNFLHDVAHARINNSMLLAQAIHTTLLLYAQKGNAQVRDRKVKRSPLLVLVGTTMPAVLVELGFVSNLHEAMLLSNKKYQELLALGVVEGICRYIERVS